MALPKQVQAQLDEADRLLAQANAPAQPLTPEALPPAPQPQAPTGLELVPAVPTPAPAPVATPAPQPPAPDVWEQRYKSLQGIHRGMQSQLQQAMDRIAQLETAQPPAPPAAAPAPTQPQRAVNPKDVETFGVDLVEYVQRETIAAIQSLTPQLDQRLNAMSAEIANLTQSVKGTSQHVAATAEQIFFAALAKAVPDWETINADEGFLAYLAEIDPIYQRPRQVALNEAVNKGNSVQAAAVFDAYTKSIRPAAAAPQPSPSPRSAASAAPAPAAQKRVYTQASVAKTIDDIRRGLYRGRDAERVALENEINLAMAEGRIV